MLEIIKNLITLLCYYLIFRYGFQMKSRKSKRKLFNIELNIWGSIVLVVIASLIYRFDMTYMLNSIYYYLFWLLVCVLVIFDDISRKQILITLGALIYFGILQAITALTLKVIFELLHIELIKYVNFLAALLLLLLVMIVMFSFPRKYEGYLRFVETKHYIIIFVVECISISILHILYNSLLRRAGRDVRKTIMIALLFVVIEMYFQIVVIILFSIKNSIYQKQNVKYEQLIQEIDVFGKAISERDKETRKFRHDMNSHLSTITRLSLTNDKSELIKYLEEMNAEREKINAVSSYGNEIADIIIHKHINSCSEFGIRFEVKGHLGRSNFVTGFDMCTILSNVLDNAEEAAKKAMNPYINLKFRQEDNRLIIICENSSQKENDVTIGKTSKEDKHNHGYGLLNIRDCVRKYEGEFHIENETNYFKLMLSFNDVVIKGNNGGVKNERSNCR